MATTTKNARKVAQIITGMEVSEGAGVRLTRLIGTPDLRNLDPFLMLDEFRSDAAEDYQAGFPEHPHRGFQTVTYMMAGKMRHQDNHGHSGLLQSGGVQWMNAGRGILHSEMPEQEDGLMWGFQLWVNLPAVEKMSEPAYQEFNPEEIPVQDSGNGIVVKIIAGKTDLNTEGAVKNIVTQPLFLDVRMNDPKRATFSQSIPEQHTAFLYVYDGSVRIENQLTHQGQLAILEKGVTIEVQNESDHAGFILIAGAPLGEPIVQRGPFVMNTWDEIVQAVEDYSRGNFA